LIGKTYYLPALPEGLQQIVLEHAKNISEWAAIRGYCTHQAIQNAATDILKRLGLVSFLDRWRGFPGEAKLLQHIFRQVIVNSSREEIEGCLNFYRQGPINKKVKRIETNFEHYGSQLATFLVRLPGVQEGTLMGLLGRYFLCGIWIL